MIDPLYTPAFLLLMSMLVGGFICLCRRWPISLSEAPFFVALLFWADLVLATQTASVFGQLGSPWFFAAAALVMMFVLAWIWGALSRAPARSPLLKAPSLLFEDVGPSQIQKKLRWVLIATLGLFALVSIVLGMSVYPDNADSMIYRLPRAFYYVTNGSFMHPFESTDNRLVYYPLNGVSLYVPLVLFGLPGTWHVWPSLLAWGLVVYATYRFARGFQAPRVWSLFAAWLVGLTPSILAQAISTNDEILAAGALLLCLYMVWRWLVSGKAIYFVTAAVALALSAGTKLHIVFLVPFIVAALPFVAWHIYKKPSLVRKWGEAIGWGPFLVAAGLLAVLFLPFLFYNYASSGRWYFFDSFKNEVFNLSGSLWLGVQNLVIYLAQMMFSPIADLNMWPVADDRQAFNTRLNELFNPLIRPLLSDNPSFYHLGYRFVGITLPVSVRFVEFSLWSAFVWLLWPLQIILALRQRGAIRWIMSFIAAIPLLWLLVWSFSTLYMEGTATYFTFYLICAAPAAALVFLKIKRAVWSDLRWIVLVFVTVTNLVICHNLVMYSGFRAVPDLFYAKKWPYDWLLTEDRIIQEVRRATHLRVVQTHEKTPYFGYIHWNPRARHYTPFSPNGAGPKERPENILQILPVSGLNMYGFMPLKIPSKLTPGLTYLGAVRAIGREAVFAVGNGVEQRYPDDSDYIVLKAEIVPATGGEWALRLGSQPMGYNPQDNLTFTYQLRKGRALIYERPAERTPAFALRLKDNPNQTPMTLTTIVRSAWSGKELTRQTYVLGMRGEWLPEGPAY